MCVRRNTGDTLSMQKLRITTQRKRGGVLMRDLSFSQRMQAGASPEELMRYYSLTPGQYDNVVKCGGRNQEGR